MWMTDPPLFFQQKNLYYGILRRYVLTPFLTPEEESRGIETCSLTVSQNRLHHIVF